MKNTLDQISDLLKSNLTEISKLQNSIQDQGISHRKQLGDIFNGIIEVIDVFDRAIERIEEKGLNETDSNIKEVSSFSGVKKKLFLLLARYGVAQLEFPDNKLLPSYCSVVETVPDSSKENDTIISITRNGYIRGKELIREAEVIIVKN